MGLRPSVPRDGDGYPISLGSIVDLSKRGDPTQTKRGDGGAGGLAKRRKHIGDKGDDNTPPDEQRDFLEEVTGTKPAPGWCAPTGVEEASESTKVAHVRASDLKQVETTALTVHECIVRREGFPNVPAKNVYRTLAKADEKRYRAVVAEMCLFDHDSGVPPEIWIWRFISLCLVYSVDLGDLVLDVEEAKTLFPPGVLAALVMAPYAFSDAICSRLGVSMTLFCSSRCRPKGSVLLDLVDDGEGGRRRIRMNICNRRLKGFLELEAEQGVYSMNPVGAKMDSSIARSTLGTERDDVATPDRR